MMNVLGAQNTESTQPWVTWKEHWNGKVKSWIMRLFTMVEKHPTFCLPFHPLNMISCYTCIFTALKKINCFSETYDGTIGNRIAI